MTVSGRTGSDAAALVVAHLTRGSRGARLPLQSPASDQDEALDRRRKSDARTPWTLAPIVSPKELGRRALPSVAREVIEASPPADARRRLTTSCQWR